MSLVLFVCCVAGTADQAGPASAGTNADAKAFFFYKPSNYGSESQFNPVTSFINYGWNALQIPESFDDDQFGGQAAELWGNLRDPAGSINDEGGMKHFVNSQLFPVDLDQLDETIEILPNYALHVMGGGMVYRKNAEWFQAHGYRYPHALAATLAMASEFIHETVEKKSTGADDAIADFYLFRPLGILLFSWDRFAEFSAETLRMGEWSYQPMLNLREGELMNVGQSYVIRPAVFGSERHRPFLYYGLATYAGMSHRVTGLDNLSWGAGAAVTDADPDDLELRLSGGIFYDRNDSLLASLIVNGTERLAVRLNVYPGAIIRSRWSPGIFVGISDDGVMSAGLTLRVFPLGLGDRW